MHIGGYYITDRTNTTSQLVVYNKWNDTMSVQVYTGADDPNTRTIVILNSKEQATITVNNPDVDPHTMYAGRMIYFSLSNDSNWKNFNTSPNNALIASVDNRNPVVITDMPPMTAFGTVDSNGKITLGNDAFHVFNSQSVFNPGAAIVKFPEGSFDTSMIKACGNQAFTWFCGRAAFMTELPKNSFRWDNLESVGTRFLSAFVIYTKIKTLPEGSFQFPKLTSIGTGFNSHFYACNHLEKLPEYAFTFDSLVTPPSGFLENSFAYDTAFDNVENFQGLTNTNFNFPAMGSVSASNFLIRFSHPTAGTHTPLKNFGNGPKMEIKNHSTVPITQYYQDENGNTLSQSIAAGGYMYYNSISKTQWILEVTEVNQDGRIMFTSIWGQSISVNFNGLDYAASANGGICYVPVSVNDVGKTMTVSSSSWRQWYQTNWGATYGIGFCVNENAGRIKLKLQQCPDFNQLTYDTEGKILGDMFCCMLFSLMSKSNTNRQAIYSISDEALWTLTNTETVEHISQYGVYSTSIFSSVTDHFPEGSFNFDNLIDITNNYGRISSHGGAGFQSLCLRNKYPYDNWYNSYNPITELPSGSFSFKNLEAVGYSFLFGFNSEQWHAMASLKRLPKNSFDFQKLTSVGNYFLENFNSGGDLENYGNGEKVSIKNLGEEKNFEYKNADGVSNIMTVPVGGYMQYNAEPPPLPPKGMWRHGSKVKDVAREGDATKSLYYQGVKHYDKEGE